MQSRVCTLQRTRKQQQTPRATARAGEREANTERAGEREANAKSSGAIKTQQTKLPRRKWRNENTAKNLQYGWRED